ncbi:MAG TPA: hypothetical protein ENI23_08560 [bacterium]|nr:hypothetical protein [bacterium]
MSSGLNSFIIFLSSSLIVLSLNPRLVFAGADSGLQTFDYAPLQVKMAVTGYGRAEKKQVQEMVKTILNLDEIPKPDDAADALAVGICHLNSS